MVTIGSDSFGGRNLTNKAFWTFRETRENLLRSFCVLVAAAI